MLEAAILHRVTRETGARPGTQRKSLKPKLLGRPEKGGSSGVAFKVSGPIMLTSVGSSDEKLKGSKAFLGIHWVAGTFYSKGNLIVPWGGSGHQEVSVNLSWVGDDLVRVQIWRATRLKLSSPPLILLP